MRVYETSEPAVYYMAVKADKYELPICVRDSVTSLAYEIGIEPWRLQAAFMQSQTGIVRPRYHGIKCMRIDSESGEIIIGGVRKHFKS